MSTLLRDIAAELVESLAKAVSKDWSIEDNLIEDMVSDAVDEQLSNDDEVISIVGEIDLTSDYEGADLFRKIQCAAQEKIRGHVRLLIEGDSRFEPGLEDRRRSGRVSCWFSS